MNTLETLIYLDLMEMDKLQAELQSDLEKNHCICGRRITDYEDIKYTEDEVLKTYKCPQCGFNGVQHHAIQYQYTEEVK